MGLEQLKKDLAEYTNSKVESGKTAAELLTEALKGEIEFFNAFIKTSIATLIIMHKKEYQKYRRWAWIPYFKKKQKRDFERLYKQELIKLDIQEKQ